MISASIFIVIAIRRVNNLNSEYNILMSHVSSGSLSEKFPDISEVRSASIISKGRSRVSGNVYTSFKLSSKPESNIVSAVLKLLNFKTDTINYLKDFNRNSTELLSSVIELNLKNGKTIFISKESNPGMQGDSVSMNNIVITGTFINDSYLSEYNPALVSFLDTGWKKII